MLDSEAPELIIDQKGAWTLMVIYPQKMQA